MAALSSASEIWTMAAYDLIKLPRLIGAAA
jgi:hypothetical protein